MFWGIPGIIVTTFFIKISTKKMVSGDFFSFLQVKGGSVKGNKIAGILYKSLKYLIFQGNLIIFML